MRLQIFLKYAKNILKIKNIPKHGEARDPFKNIFCILINKKKCTGTTVSVDSTQFLKF